MKKIIFLLIFLLQFTSISALAQEEVFTNDESNTFEEITNRFYAEYNIDDLEQYFQDSGINEVIKYNSIKDFLHGIFKGELQFNLDTILEAVKLIFFNEISLSLSLLAQIIFLSIMAAILNNISTSFGKSEINDIAFYVIYFVLIALIVRSFYSSIQLASNTIEEMVNFIQAILPTLFLLMASVGAIASSGMLSPLIMYIVTFLGTVINDIIYPLIIASAIISLIDHLSKEVKLSNLAKLLKDTALSILGFLFIVFLGISSIQGIAMGSLDGLTSKTAKYAIDNFIPFVGGFLADTMDTVIGAANLLKNGVGIIGLLIIVSIIAFPVIKIFVLFVMFRVSAAIIQPISDDRIVKCLSDTGSYISLILACILVVAVMFFLLISMIVLLGDMTIMFR